MDYLSVWLIIIIPSSSYWLGTYIGLFQVFIHFFVFFMAIYSYIKIISTPPGNTPNNWRPKGFTDEELEDAKTVSQSKEKSRTRNREHNVPRYCVICNNFKPPRTHHCTECNKCTLRMDHHCPWINNCVGYNNHKLFVTFLFWGATGIIYTIIAYLVKILLMFYSIVSENPNPEYMSPFQGVLMVVNLVILCPIILGMISLYFWQHGIASQNLTTIEYHIKRCAKKQAQKEGKKYIWLYDLGAPKNIILFYGSNPRHWLCPIKPNTLGDGTEFEINPLANDYMDEELQCKKSDLDDTNNDINDDSIIDV